MRTATLVPRRSSSILILTRVLGVRSSADGRTNEGRATLQYIGGRRLSLCFSRYPCDRRGGGGGGEGVPQSLITASSFSFSLSSPTNPGLPYSVARPTLQASDVRTYVRKMHPAHTYTHVYTAYCTDTRTQNLILLLYCTLWLVFRATSKNINIKHKFSLGKS